MKNKHNPQTSLGCVGITKWTNYNFKSIYDVKSQSEMVYNFCFH